MNATFGTSRRCSPAQAAAVSSAAPPISPMSTIASVSASAANSWSDVEERRPDDRVAADADARRLAEARVGHRLDRLVGQRARARDDADAALAVDRAGMIPTLARPGDVAPGQLGPISRAPARLDDLDRRDHVEGRDALGDAEDRRDAGGRRLHDGVRRAGGRDEDAARCSRRSRGTASATVSKTGTVPSSASWPPLPGVTPATTVGAVRRASRGRGTRPRAR